jgi:hypothetical protein
MVPGSQKTAKENIVYPYFRFQQEVPLNLSLKQVARFTTTKKGRGGGLHSQGKWKIVYIRIPYIFQHNKFSGMQKSYCI